MDRVLGALLTDENCSDDLRFAYYLLSLETTHTEDKTAQNIVKNVKSLLSSSKTRYRGLVFLSNLLERLSSDIFIENSSVLIQHVFKVLQESKIVEERILGYKVLTQFFAKIYRLDAQTLTRELGTCIIPLLTQCIGNMKYGDIYYASNWLCACASLFPSPVSAKRAFLEIKIIDAVNLISEDDGDIKTLKVLGFAYAKVMLAGNLNLQKYREFFSKLLNTFVQHFDFFNVFSIKKPNSFAVQFENDQCITQFCKEGSDIFLDPLKKARRLHFLTSAICAVITGQYSGTIPLPVEGILECLNLFMLISNGNISENHSVDVFAIGHVIPILYENIFIILKALLTSCKNSLIPFTRLINRILISTIEWLDQLKSTEKQLYMNLRCSVYSFLELYFNVVGGKMCLPKSELQLIAKHLVENVKMHKQNITFFKNSNNQMNSLAAQNACKELQEKATLSAIRAINRLISSLGNTLDPSAYTLFQNEVIIALLQIYRGWFNLSSPYKNEKCRQGLIEMLTLLLQNIPPSITPPLETSILLFRQAYQIDKSPAVRYLVENCFNLVNFILSSRLSPDYADVSVKNLLLESLQPSERLSTSSFMPSEEGVKSAVPKMQKEANFSLIKPKVEAVSSEKPKTSDSSSAQGFKRKNETSADPVTSARKIVKPKQTVNLNDSDIIFEGAFERKEALSKSASEEVEKFDKNASKYEETTAKVSLPLTTSIEEVDSSSTSSNETVNKIGETAEASEEVDDALKYFIAE